MQIGACEHLLYNLAPDLASEKWHFKSRWILVDLKKLECKSRSDKNMRKIQT